MLLTPVPRRWIVGHALAAVLASGVACNNTPRPAITIGPESRAQGDLAVRAHIVPNQFAVTDVLLEFGRRPNTSSAVHILYNSGQTSYSLPHAIVPPPPTTAPIEATFTFVGASNNPFLAGEVIDYQFKVTHRDANGGSLFFWSERRSFQIEPPHPAVPPGTGGGGGGGQNCQNVPALVSKSSANQGAPAGVVSGDGAFVAFVTAAGLDANDTNGVADVYRLEVATGDVKRVTGLAAATRDRGGDQPSISSDGRFVAFRSASNFDPNDTNAVDDVYRRDMNATGAAAFARVTGLAAVTNDLGGSQPSISSDGRFVAFTSRSNFAADDTNGTDDVYRRDMNAGAAVFARVSGLAAVPNDLGGNQPSISSDGRFVAFTSKSNFDSNDTNGVDDVYRRDMNGTGATAFARVTGLASVTSDHGGNQPSISSDGRFVAFTSQSNFETNDTNGVEDVYRRDMNGNNAAAFARVTGLAAVTNDLGGSQPSISSTGRFVVFTSKSNFDPNDTNGIDDVYRRDMCQ